MKNWNSSETEQMMNRKQQNHVHKQLHYCNKAADAYIKKQSHFNKASGLKMLHIQRN